VAALKQVLVTQLMSQEALEQTKRSTGVRLLRTTSLRTPVDSRARVPVHNGAHTEDPAQDLGSGDTGFFDSPEDDGEPGKVMELGKLFFFPVLEKSRKTKETPQSFLNVLFSYVHSRSGLNTLYAF